MRPTSSAGGPASKVGVAPEILEPGALVRAVRNMAGASVLVLGDVMLDHYLAGDVERISPEAPVPVVHVESERHLLGGAGNVARNIAALGGRPVLVSVVGDDDPGRAIGKLLAQEGIASHLLVEARRQTTIKTRIIARNQQLVRVDREQVRPVEGHTLEGLRGILAEIVPQHAMIVVSDYGKGVVNKFVMDALRQILCTLPSPPRVLVDPKVVNAAVYAGVDVLTPNAKEAGELAGIKAQGQGGVIKAGLAIFKRLRCKQLCITLGSEGMALFDEPGKVVHVPTVARKVFDVTGAGDTVIASLALGLASGLDLLRAGMLANYAAGIVVGQVGTATASPDEVAAAISAQPAPGLETWLDIA